MSKSIIRFINANDPSEIISVADQDSAFILSRVLSKNWSIEGQEPVATPVPPPVPVAEVAAAPVAVIPTAPVAKEFRVILISGTSTFRCASCDVSLGGMKLKNEVPATFCSKTCTAYISHDDMRENIEMSCQVVTDETGATRIKFVKPAKVELERLSEWMAEQAS